MGGIGLAARVRGSGIEQSPSNSAGITVPTHGSQHTIAHPNVDSQHTERAEVGIQHTNLLRNASDLILKTVF